MADSLKTVCLKCNAPISGNERGLCLKYLGRQTQDFYCIRCLAEKFGTSVEALEEKILFFRRQGCMLFPPLEGTYDKNKLEGF